MLAGNPVEMMTPRQRVQAVYEGRVPDQVPLMLDLSHWYKRNAGIPFDLTGLKAVEPGLVELHRRARAVCYVEMGSFYDLAPRDPEISVAAATADGVYSMVVATPERTLREERVFNAASYSYGIRKHLLESVEDFHVVRRLMGSLACTPRWERLRAWERALGDLACPYVQLPYSGLGYLIARHFGVERTVYAMADHPAETRALVDAVNACNLRILDAVIDGPFDVVFISDNIDATVQTERLLRDYSQEYYTAVARRAHQAGKRLAVHVDGEMRGALRFLAGCGVDCVDAATPRPMFSLLPGEARAEAGPDLILSGGIPATVFGAAGPDGTFVDVVRRWLDTRLASPRLILAAGDQVPPEAPWRRIEQLPELVERYGRF
jgi:hypothetical protein